MTTKFKDKERSLTEDSKNVDFLAREYQVEIYEKAIKENVIVFLPTGCGKTFISVMVIKHYISDLKKSYRDGGKRVFFLVNTVPLVEQQAIAIKNLLSLEVGQYSGDKGVDGWNKSDWEEEQNNNQVLVMSAQIYLDMILHNFTDIKRACLIIFDECHHAVHKHQMRQIMQEIEKLDYMPRILGLTAALLNCKVNSNKVKSEIETLEATFHARVVKALNDDMVLQYSTNPNEKVLYYEDDSEPTQFTQLIENFNNRVNENYKTIDMPESKLEGKVPPPNAVLLNDLTCKSLKKILLGLKDSITVSKELGLFGADISLLSLIIQIQRAKVVAHDYMYRFFCYIETGLHLLRKQFSILFKNSSSSIKPLLYATKKVITLVHMLKNFDENSRAIVFVDRRSTAHALHHIVLELSLHQVEFKKIRSEYIVGSNQDSKVLSVENIMIKKKNNRIIKQFNSGDINVLFASNVIEEGIDIRACNIVIKFDPPLTFRSYCQSKGRARHKHSNYIIMAPYPQSSNCLFSSNYNKFREIEHNLKIILCEDREKLNETYSEDDDDDDDNLHEFVTPKGSKVTAYSAISLINRYCSKLPQDKFSNLTSLWWVKKVVNKGKTDFIGYLQLPINSSIRTVIEGLPRKSKLSAKRLVALEACRRLYELGDFDDNLLPLSHITNMINDKNLFPHWNNEYTKNNMKKSLKAKRRFFKKHYSKWECECRPVAGNDVYLHVINISPNYPYPDTSRLQAFYNLLLHDSTFGILTSCPWPEIPAFPLFMNVGEVKITIRVNENIINFTEEQITQLKDFHKLLFTDILSILKKYCVRNDLDNQIDDYTIVPVLFKGYYDIDWQTIYNRKEFPEIKPKPFGQRLEGEVTEDLYNMKIVIPWYRLENYNLKYIVTKVCSDETPLSQFPSENFKSYSDYFLHRYNQKIYDMNQPMLEVRAISSKINCITPRGEYHVKRNKREDDGFEETLVPELCYLISCPAWYVLKVTLLPSVFHRIHHLLVAEELRQTIAEQTGMGSLDVPSSHKWKELSVDLMKVNKVESEETINPDANTNVQSFEEEDDLMTLGSGEKEPIDISRVLDVDLAAILHYSQFVDKPVNLTGKNHQTLKKPHIIKMNNVKPIDIIKGTYPGYGPEPVDMLMVLTAASSNDYTNYERAELLGDSFLKFAASLALFTFFPNLNEGKLSHIKGKIIGNMNLFFCGLAKNLPGMLKVNAFDYKDWKVPGFVLPSKLQPYLEDPVLCSSVFAQLSAIELENSDISEQKMAKFTQQLANDFRKLDLKFLSGNEGDHESSDSLSDGEPMSINKKILTSSCKDEYSMRHSVPEKVVSDSVEALISIYLQNFGIVGGFKILNWLEVLPKSICDINTMLYSKPESPLLNTNFDMISLLPNMDKLEETINYTFKDKGFLIQALSHSSHPHNTTDCYQRFEFLGDAILDFLLTSYIFHECKDMGPGDLTDLRSALVNNVTFACITVRYRLHTHLIYRACKLSDLISKFVNHQEKRNHEVGHEVFYLIEESSIQIAESIDVPKVLGDIFESLVAAIYLDSGRDLHLVWKFIYSAMETEIKKFCKDIPKNAIRTMYEKFSAYPVKFGKPEAKQGSVMIPLEVVHQGQLKIFHGIGENKYSAKMAASKIALKYFNMC